MDEIREAARLLAGASKPLIISGGGVIAAGAEAELVGLARRLGAPVITTVMGGALVGILAMFILSALRHRLP